MIDTAVQDLIRMEAELEGLSHRLAAILRQSVPSDQADEMTTLWQQIAAREWPYGELIRSLSPSDLDFANGPGSLSTQRRDLQKRGPLRAQQWKRMGQLVHRQSVPFFEPLITESSNRMRGREDGYVHNMMRALFALANPLAEDRDRVPELNHRDIGLTGPYFFNLMTAVYRLHRAQGRPRPARFIDVGCGGGTKVFGASSFFEECVGLEYDGGYVDHARDWMARVGAPGCEILHGDALDFTDFGSFDIIYMYRPIKDRPLQVQLESQIFEQARPGTIVVAPLNYSFRYRDQTEATPIADPIYIAHSTPEDANALRNVAETYGTDQGLDDTLWAADMGFWQPILAASRDRGFEPAP